MRGHRRAGLLLTADPVAALTAAGACDDACHNCWKDTAMIFKPMPPQVKAAFRAELDATRAAPDGAAFWAAAERAHILSQPWPWPHTWAHAVMLRRALKERDRIEAVGQVIRLLAAGPASAVGRYPEGNTGRARVPLTRTMPVPADLAALLDRA